MLTIADVEAVHLAVGLVIRMRRLPNDVASLEELAGRYGRATGATPDGISECLDTTPRRLVDEIRGRTTNDT